MDDNPRVLVVDAFSARGECLAGELVRAGIRAVWACAPPVGDVGVDVVLVDVAHPSCVSIARWGRSGTAAVLVVGAMGHPGVLSEALASGAAGFVSVDEPPERLADAVREVSRRGTLGGHRLTRRQAQVLALMATGLANREIAGRLGIRPHTVKNHVQSILGKLGVASRAAAAAALSGAVGGHARS
ncbi:DNA-binding NarL/FixJ family response regulator [Nocardiopsis sp. Huas11]|uniref:LuxR C-terminal-related transcriptional regulator n=1 Tax=Nocardiopsis sp. Huas11 TaxID=2183912 RepID=UPI000EB4D38A|nr:LuxR C-terminal-related transcriptional regulator [Nocardiopsis sp. Huas11]RKS08147.1 DNA-binding NarL/FixJ family response regulator [Nocardiopsis sp. Huas11]